MTGQSFYSQLSYVNSFHCSLEMKLNSDVAVVWCHCHCVKVSMTLWIYSPCYSSDSLQKNPSSEHWRRLNVIERTNPPNFFSLGQEAHEFRCAGDSESILIPGCQIVTLCQGLEHLIHKAPNGICMRRSRLLTPMSSTKPNQTSTEALLTILN